MSSARPTIKRTYGQAGQRKFAPLPPSPRTSPSCPSSPRANDDQPETPSPAKRKRPLADLFSNDLPLPSKKKKVTPALKNAKANAAKSARKAKDAKTNAALTQLHFCIDQSTLRTCALCGLSYTCGAPDDETLHRAHCARVRKGMEWGREEEKERGRAAEDVTVVNEDVRTKDGARGRIIAVKASVNGKLGHKLAAYLKTVNLALSAPDLEPSALQKSKAYLFLLSTPGSTREKIVGCVLAQHITDAMEVATREEVAASDDDARANLIHVEGNLYCKTERHRTPMGIPRLFVSSAYRRKGVAQALLSAAAATFIHGCKLDPAKGEVAFSQPTSMGRAVMEKWGRGGVRIYIE